MPSNFFFYLLHLEDGMLAVTFSDTLSLTRNCAIKVHLESLKGVGQPVMNFLVFRLTCHK